MHPWMMGIQFCSNEGSCPFPRGDKSKKAKTISTNFSRTIESISTKLAIDTKHSWMKRTKVFTYKGPFNSQKGDNDFFCLNVMV